MWQAPQRLACWCCYKAKRQVDTLGNESGKKLIYCKKCFKRYIYPAIVQMEVNLRKKDIRESLIKACEGKCPSCKRSIKVGILRDGWAFHHDHETGQYIGVICLRCNIAFGMFEDNSKIMLRAFRWLAKNHSKRKFKGKFSSVSSIKKRRIPSLPKTRSTPRFSKRV